MLFCGLLLWLFVFDALVFGVLFELWAVSFCGWVFVITVFGVGISILFGVTCLFGCTVVCSVFWILGVLLW